MIKISVNGTDATSNIHWWASSTAAIPTVINDGSLIEAASLLEKMGRSLEGHLNRAILSGEQQFTWETDLWDRREKQRANARINQLQGHARLARGSRSRAKIELEMLRLGDQVRRLSK